MAQWYVKELSQLTHVSVQTLHHYDRIDLLKPSIRQANGYRLYSEKDLLRLQQILALKYFGFKLSQIKTLLAGDVNVIDHLTAQSRFLEEKAQSLVDASNALKQILTEHSHDKSIPWETIVNVIEVYRMTNEIEKSWAGKVLNPEELKDYVKFSQELPKRFTEEETKANKQEWANLVRDINLNLNNDPHSDVGIQIGKRCHEWVYKLYPKEHIELRRTIWEKGFKGGEAGDEYGLSTEAVAWLDQAMRANCIDQINRIFKQANSPSDTEVTKEWNHFLTEMYGDNQFLKDELVKAALTEDRVSEAAKKWLKNH